MSLGSRDKLGSLQTACSTSLVATAALLAGVVSWFASAHPDGLEWSYLHRSYGSDEAAVAEPSPAMAEVDRLHGQIARLPDYNLPAEAAGAEDEAEDDGAWPAVSGWGSLAGRLGTAITLGLVYLLAVVLRRRPAPAAAD